MTFDELRRDNITGLALRIAEEGSAHPTVINRVNQTKHKVLAGPRGAIDGFISGNPVDHADVLAQLDVDLAVLDIFREAVAQARALIAGNAGTIGHVSHANPLVQAKYCRTWP